MADVVTLRGEAFAPTPEVSPREGFAAYFRGLAEQIEAGNLVIDSLVLVMQDSGGILLQRLNQSPLEAMGMCMAAARVIL